MDVVKAVLVAELRLGLVSRVWPLSDHRWLVDRGGLSELLVLDDQLTPIRRLGLPAGRLDVLAVAEDLSLVTVSRDGQVMLLDGTGRQLASFPGADSKPGGGAFTAAGGLLWVLPGRASESPVTANQELWLIDVATPSIVDRRRVGVAVEGCQPVRHPDGHTVGLSLWIDGHAAVGWAVAERGRIDLRFCPWRDRVLADVHPAGLEYLTVPWRWPDQPLAGGGEDELLRLRLNDARPVAGLAVSAVAEPEDLWDRQASYLTSDLILASTIDTGWHLLIGTAPMRLLAEVAYPSPIAGSAAFPSGQGTWLTFGDGRVQRWVLPPAAGEQLRLPLT
jgi:hypothetical protein